MTLAKLIQTPRYLVHTLAVVAGFDVRIKMSTSNNTGGRQNKPGSPNSGQIIPHTRIEDESHMQQYYDIG